MSRRIIDSRDAAWYHARRLRRGSILTSIGLDFYWIMPVVLDAAGKVREQIIIKHDDIFARSEVRSIPGSRWEGCPDRCAV